MSPFTQDNRPLRVTTGLGKDVLLLERFSGDEGVSMPFRFTLEMLSEKTGVDPRALLRQPVCVAIALPGGGERIVHGRISRFAQLGRRAGLTAYKAEMVPWLWFLSLSTDCRIFQNQSVTEIVGLLFKEAGFTDFKVKLLKPLAQRTYCVQYRESTLAFVSRLLEEEGVFYFFEHTASAHTLVLTDNRSQVVACPVVSKLRMTASASFDMVDEPVVSGLEMDHAAFTGSVTLSSFDYEHPKRGLLATVTGQEPNEVYDYFGGYTEKPDGERYAQMRLEQKEAEQLTIQGESNCASLTSGFRFELTEHPIQTANDTYHVLRVRHAASIPNYVSGTTGGFEYSNTFDAIPHESAYRPSLVTPRPIVHGTQTAIVTGPAGEEIYVDKLARVKIHFHWDRRGSLDENSSCWVRVSAEWAGKGYGSIHIPRIGQEVIVDFLEGDPDQPIIVGRVYNGDMTPPYKLPGAGIVSGGKSQTHKGKGANEMTMDDTTGKEKITINAQYDLSTTVGHDETHSVTNNRTTKIDVDDKETIGNNQTIDVGVNQQLTVGSNRKTSVGANDTVSVSANRSSSIGGNETHTVSGKRTLGISGTDTVTVSGARTTKVGGSDDLNVSGSSTIGVGGSLSITAATEIKMSVGGSTVTIGPAGVTISAPKVDITGTGPVTVTGAIVKVNS